MLHLVGGAMGVTLHASQSDMHMYEGYTPALKGFDFVHNSWSTEVMCRNKSCHNFDINKELFVIHCVLPLI